MVKFVVKYVLKMCGKICGKIENCWIGTKIGVVVDIDTPIIIVVSGKICGKHLW